MKYSPRPSLLRAPLVVVAIFVLALLALYPGASLRAQGIAHPLPPNAPAPATAVMPGDPPADLDGEVADMYVKGKRLEVVYRNTGRLATQIMGELQVRDEAGELVTTATIVEAKVIGAGRSEKLRVAMPTLAPGRYTLYAVVDFGGDALTAAEAALEIKP
ncbi:MAG: hypothetical protein IBJ03_16505 [Gemmatimonadaceae bacterium]|nr:hypothetical protein [Gemmatimonadaceae bacterium]